MSIAVEGTSKFIEEYLRNFIPNPIIQILAFRVTNRPSNFLSDGVCYSLSIFTFISNLSREELCEV